MKRLLVKNPEDAVTVLETRGGKFAGVIRGPGFHLVAPWKKAVSCLTTETFHGLDGIGASTRDGKNVVVSVSMGFTIRDVEKYHCAAKQPYNAAVAEIRQAAKEIVAGIGLAKVWEERARIARKVHAAVAPVLAEKFGLSFEDINVQQISLSSHCMSAPGDELKKILAIAAAMPDTVAQEMDKGLETGISVRKPLALRKRI
ncbi:MAG: SPFH domain-containing protein [Alphaproteobacteria bacterium]